MNGSSLHLHNYYFIYMNDIFIHEYYHSILGLDITPLQVVFNSTMPTESTHWVTCINTHVQVKLAAPPFEDSHAELHILLLTSVGKIIL